LASPLGASSLFSPIFRGRFKKLGKRGIRVRLNPSVPFSLDPQYTVSLNYAISSRRSGPSARSLPGDSMTRLRQSFNHLFCLTSSRQLGLAISLRVHLTFTITRGDFPLTPKRSPFLMGLAEPTGNWFHLGFGPAPLGVFTGFADPQRSSYLQVIGPIFASGFHAAD